MSIHEGVNYSCNQCDSKFTQQGALKQHKMTVHEGVIYPSNQCDSIYTQQSHLKRHKKSVHESFKFVLLF